MIKLDFDATVAPFGLNVRVETLALAGVILVALILAALAAGRVRAGLELDGQNRGTGPAMPRRDDLILIAFGAVPGAVVGGRIGYGLMHWDYFGSDPGMLTDPGKGGLTLTLAVLFGVVTALAVARLLAAPIGRWLAISSGPLLVGLGLGKLAMILGGDGQGAFSDSSWATAYVRPGSWASYTPAAPAFPSQALEGLLVLAVAILILVVPVLLRLRLRRWRRIVRPGVAPRREWKLLSGYRRFVTALALWAVVRFGVAFTWRDARVLGPLGVEQIELAGVLVLCAGVLLVAGLVDGRRARRAARAAAVEAERNALPMPRSGFDSAALR